MKIVISEDEKKEKRRLRLNRNSAKWRSNNKEKVLKIAKLYRENNKEKRNIAKEKWEKDNPDYRKEWIEKNKINFREKEKAYRYRKVYGISIEDFNLMVKNQNYKCDICKLPLKLENKKSFGLDHDHISSKIRGILCNTCNSGLGMFKDKIENLELAIDYLYRNKWKK
jgi:hypothetical protein